MSEGKSIKEFYVEYLNIRGSYRRCSVCRNVESHTETNFDTGNIFFQGYKDCFIGERIFEFTIDLVDRKDKNHIFFGDCGSIKIGGCEFVVSRGEDRKIQLKLIRESTAPLILAAIKRNNVMCIGDSAAYRCVSHMRIIISYNVLD